MIKNELWLLIAQSDMVSKAVLLLLLGCSVVCWALFFAKIVLLRIKLRDSAAVEGRLKLAKTVNDVHAFVSEYVKTAPGYLVLSVMSMYKKYEAIPQGAFLQELLARDTAIVIDDMMSHDERSTGFLSVCAAIAPLLGLLGTVWGLIHAFIDMSQARTADIATVAPGVAEALITTLAGLLVAIPALVMNYYIGVRLREIESQLYRLADKTHALYTTHYPYKEGLCSTNVSVGAEQELGR